MDECLPRAMPGAEARRQRARRIPAHGSEVCCRRMSITMSRRSSSPTAIEPYQNLSFFQNAVAR